jgi:prevent-host-death family protein
MSDKKKKGKYDFVPEMVSTSELQRGAGRVIDAVREGGEPYYVVRNNTPQAVLLSLEEYEKLKKKQREWEIKDTLEAIAEAEKAIESGEVYKLTDEVMEEWLKEAKERDDD